MFGKQEKETCEGKKVEISRVIHSEQVWCSLMLLNLQIRCTEKKNTISILHYMERILYVKILESILNKHVAETLHV